MNFQKIQRELDYYNKFIPVNFAEERKIFFECVRTNEPYNPVFRYHDKLKVKDYEDIKVSLKKEKGKDAIVDEFLNVHLDVADMMIAWKNKNYADISIISGQLFGTVDDFNLDQAIKLYQDLKILSPDSKVIYNHKQLGASFLEELKKRNLSGWVIEYNEASAGNVSIYETEKKVGIRTGATESKLSWECALCHELDGHAYQAFNAMANEHYRKWFLSYLGTERQYEGYATFVAINNLSTPHIKSELKEGLILMIATALAQRSSFFKTYQKIYNLCGDKNFSFYAAYKAKRGFQDTAQPGCFQKENSYLLGALEIISLVEDNEENYYKLSQGCFPLSALRLISDRQLIWSGIKDFNLQNLNHFKILMNRVKRAFK
jgi:hypothetical protein